MNLIHSPTSMAGQALPRADNAALTYLSRPLPWPTTQTTYVYSRYATYVRERARVRSRNAENTRKTCMSSLLLLRSVLRVPFPWTPTLPSYLQSFTDSCCLCSRARDSSYALTRACWKEHSRRRVDLTDVGAASRSQDTISKDWRAHSAPTRAAVIFFPIKSNLATRPLAFLLGGNIYTVITMSFIIKQTLSRKNKNQKRRKVKSRLTNRKVQEKSVLRRRCSEQTDTENKTNKQGTIKCFQSQSNKGFAGSKNRWLVCRTSNRLTSYWGNRCARAAFEPHPAIHHSTIHPEGSESQR